MLRLPKVVRLCALATSVAVPVVLAAGPLTGTAAATRPPAPTPPSTSTWPASPSNNPTPSFTWTAPSTSYNYVCSLDNNRVPCAAGSGSPLAWSYQVPVASSLKDGTHTFAVRTKVTGHRPITTTYSWRQDTVPPAAPSVAQPPASTRATSVSVSFSDSDPSVDHFVCSLDGAAPSSCQSPFAATGLSAAPHHLTVAALDLAGNSASTTVSWTVDPNAADYPVVAGPTSPTRISSASVSFSTVNSATFACTLDNPDHAAATACASPVSLTGLGDGSHTYTVWATDTAANTWANSATWVVDTTPPAQPSLLAGPSATSDDTSPTFWFTDEFDLTGVHYTCTVTDLTASTVVAGPQPCASPYDVNLDPATPDGHHFQLHVVPTDGAGNDGTALDVAWTLDQSISPSPIVWLAAPSSPSNVLEPTFSFNAPDAGQPGGATGFRCALDTDTYVACGAPDATTGDGSYAVTSNLTNGPHTFKVEATNSSAASSPMAWTWTVDTTPPAAPVVTAPGSPSPNPTITFSDSDPTVTFLCSIDGGPFVPCSSPWTPPAGLANGSHTLVVEAMDPAGNITKADPVIFTTGTATQPSGGSSDTTAPTVSSITTPAALTGSALVTYSETVQGLATYGVVYSVTGSQAVLPARVSCLSGATAVACTSPFTAVRLAPSVPLVPGQHYTVLAMAGATHDLAGNASVTASKAFRGARVLEENSIAAHPRWAARTNTAAIGGSYVVERRAGASATWSFVGTSVTWWTVTGPTQGKAYVYVDGVRKATVNNYASARHFRVARVVTGLANTRHTVTIRVAGLKGSTKARGTLVVVDAFTVGKVRTATPVLTMTLRRAANKHFLAGRAIVADLKGDTVFLTFRGTAVAWYTVKAANQGRVAVYVDGVRKQVLDNYAATTTFGVRRAVSHLSDTLHTLKLVVLGTHHKGGTGTWVTVDRFAVT